MGKAWRTSIFAVIACLVGAGCSEQTNTPSIVATYRVSGDVEGTGTVRSVEDRSFVVEFDGAEPITDLVTVDGEATPTGEAVITVPRSDDVADRDVVVVGLVADSVDDVRALVPITVTETSVSFTTSRFGYFQAFAVSVDLVEAELAALANTVSAGGSFVATPPQCAGDASSLNADASGSDALLWCVGDSAAGAVASVVNNRRYPLVVDAKAATVPTLDDSALREAIEQSLKSWSSTPGATTVLSSERVDARLAIPANGPASFAIDLRGGAQFVTRLSVAVEMVEDLLAQFGVGDATEGDGDSLVMASAFRDGACLDPTAQDQVATAVQRCFAQTDWTLVGGPMAQTSMARNVLLASVQETLLGHAEAVAESASQSDQFELTVRRSGAGSSSTATTVVPQRPPTSVPPTSRPPSTAPTTSRVPATTVPRPQTTAPSRGQCSLAELTAIARQKDFFDGPAEFSELEFCDGTWAMLIAVTDSTDYGIPFRHGRSGWEVIRQSQINGCRDFPSEMRWFCG